MLIPMLAVVTVMSLGQDLLRTPAGPERGMSAAHPLSVGRAIEVPARAMERGVSGRAVVRCEVNAVGRLTACMLVEETPPGFGFGRELIRAAGRAELPADSPWIGRTAYFGASFDVR